MTGWERLDKECVDNNPWFRISRDRYRLPGGDVGTYTYVDIPGSTMVIPRLPDGRVVMVRQYRYLMQRESLEFPCGGLKEGYEPLFNAQEELREEAGLEATSWTKLGEFAPYNGVSNEYCHVYLAEEFSAVPATPEETESIEILHMTFDEIRTEIARGTLWDGMTVACLSIYDAHHPTVGNE